MSLLVFALIVLVLTVLVVWALDFLPITSPFMGIIKFLVVIIAVVVIASRAGIL